MYKGHPMLKAEEQIKGKLGISANFHQYSQSGNQNIHWHNYYTIDIILSGEGTHHLNGQDHSVQSGDIMLIRPTDIHYLCSDTEMKTACIRFIDRAIDGEYRHIVQYLTTTRRLTDEDLTLMNMYCRTIARCNDALAVNPDNELYCDELLFSFHLVLILLARQKNTIPTISDTRITQVIQYINMHFREQITQETIAEYAGLNPTYFSKWFKENSGVSYIKYITQCRIEYACSMLKRGSSVIESCFESGFNSLSNFNHTFKNIVGKSPRHYKRDVSENSVEKKA